MSSGASAADDCAYTAAGGGPGTFADDAGVNARAGLIAVPTGAAGATGLQIMTATTMVGGGLAAAAGSQVSFGSL